MNQSLLALYGLKWNPFSQELPTEALRLTRPAEDFLWRIEHNLVREGGFALIQGDPGTGKSVVMRLLAERLERKRSSNRILVTTCPTPETCGPDELRRQVGGGESGFLEEARCGAERVGRDVQGVRAASRSVGAQPAALGGPVQGGAVDGGGPG